MYYSADTAWLLHLLSDLKRSARRSLFLSGFCSVFFPSALLYAVFVFIHFTLVSVPLLIYCMPPVAAFSFAIFRGLFTLPSDEAVLYKTDQIYDLKSQLLTAFAICRSSGTISMMEKMQLSSACRSLPSIRPSKVFPLRPGIPNFLMYLPGVLFAVSIAAAVLMNSLTYDVPDQIAGSARRLEAAVERAAELTPEDEIANRELLERIEALGRRLSERQMEKEEAVFHSLQLQEELQTRIEELERDLLAQSIDPDRHAKVPDTPELALRRDDATRDSDLAVGSEKLTVPSDPSSGNADGNQPAKKIESYTDTLNALDNLTDQLEQSGEVGVPDIDTDMDIASSGGLRSDTRSSGKVGASPGSAASEDRFEAEFEEEPGPSDEEKSIIRGRSSGDTEASIVTRTYSEPGEALLPFMYTDTTYEPGLEQVFPVQSIHPDDRDLALRYLYAIGMSEGGPDE